MEKLLINFNNSSKSSLVSNFDIYEFLKKSKKTKNKLNIKNPIGSLFRRETFDIINNTKKWSNADFIKNKSMGLVFRGFFEMFENFNMIRYNKLLDVFSKNTNPIYSPKFLSQNQINMAKTTDLIYAIDSIDEILDIQFDNNNILYENVNWAPYWTAENYAEVGNGVFENLVELENKTKLINSALKSNLCYNVSFSNFNNNVKFLGHTESRHSFENESRGGGSYGDTKPHLDYISELLKNSVDSVFTEIKNSTNSVLVENDMPELYIKIAISRILIMYLTNLFNLNKEDCLYIINSLGLSDSISYSKNNKIDISSIEIKNIFSVFNKNLVSVLGFIVKNKKQINNSKLVMDIIVSFINKQNLKKELSADVLGTSYSLNSLFSKKIKILRNVKLRSTYFSIKKQQDVAEMGYFADRINIDSFTFSFNGIKKKILKIMKNLPL